MRDECNKAEAARAAGQTTGAHGYTDSPQARAEMGIGYGAHGDHFLANAIEAQRRRLAALEHLRRSLPATFWDHRSRSRHSPPFADAMRRPRFKRPSDRARRLGRLMAAPLDHRASAPPRAREAPSDAPPLPFGDEHLEQAGTRRKAGAER